MDTVFCLKKVQIINDKLYDIALYVVAVSRMLFLSPAPLSVDQNIEEIAGGAYWVTDGVDRCQAGFLPPH